MSPRMLTPVCLIRARAFDRASAGTPTHRDRRPSRSRPAFRRRSRTVAAPGLTPEAWVDRLRGTGAARQADQFALQRPLHQRHGLLDAVKRDEPAKARPVADAPSSTSYSALNQSRSGSNPCSLPTAKTIDCKRLVVRRPVPDLQPRHQILHRRPLRVVRQPEHPRRRDLVGKVAHRIPRRRIQIRMRLRAKPPEHTASGTSTAPPHPSPPKPKPGSAASQNCTTIRLTGGFPPWICQTGLFTCCSIVWSGKARNCW